MGETNLSSKRLMQIACTVDFGVNIGWNFGFLFEAYDAKDLVVLVLDFLACTTPHAEWIDTRFFNPLSNFIVKT